MPEGNVSQSIRFELKGTLTAIGVPADTPYRRRVAVHEPKCGDMIEAASDFIPGSSIRGLLRHHLERVCAWQKCEPTTVTQLFGTTTTAARLRVSDARRLDQRAPVFGDVEPDSQFSLHIVYERGGKDDREWLLLNEIVRALKAGELCLGGKSHLGRGQLRLSGDSDWRACTGAVG